MPSPDGPARPATRIRRARPADVPVIHELIRALAAYEREPDAVQATADDLHRALFAESPLAHAHVAEVGAPDPETFAVVGMAVWFVSYSTWRGRHGIWLEDLFVLPEHRGLGLGRALLAALAAETVERGYTRLEWNVLDWNAPSLGFYASLGAQPLDEWTVHRLDGAPLAALATEVGARGEHGALAEQDARGEHDTRAEHDAGPADQPPERRVRSPWAPATRAAYAGDEPSHDANS